MTVTAAEQAERGSDKHAGGPARKYENPEEMQEAIDEYFKGEGKKSVCGLALFLGFYDYGGLWKYETYYGEEFGQVIAHAKLRIMRYYEELGQEVRSGMFPDRMLTRMRWPCVEQSGIAGEGGTTIVAFSSPEQVKEIESRVSDALPGSNEETG